MFGWTATCFLKVFGVPKGWVRWTWKLCFKIACVFVSLDIFSWTLSVIICGYQCIGHIPMHSDITTPWCHWLKVHSYITTQGSTKPLQGWSWWTDSAEVQRDFESCGLALGSVDSLVSSIYFCRFFADFWGLSQFHDGGINLKRYCQHFRTLCVLAYISFSIRAWHSTVCHAILWPDFLQLQEKLGTNCRWDWPTLIRGEVLPFESCP